MTKTCIMDDCDAVVVARGLCDKHRKRLSRRGETGDAGLMRYRRAPGTLCAVSGCDLPAKSLGWCPKHYQRLTPRPVCKHPDGCPNGARRNGWCGMHWQRITKTGDAGPVGKLPHGSWRAPEMRCQHQDGCPNRARQGHSGWCTMHASRIRTSGDPGPVGPIRVRTGLPYMNDKGYMVFHGRTVHRVVMEEFLGRPLLRSESPHHKNGDRADNRISNLELWSTNQPAGQRVVDKVAWAREIIARYGAEIEMLTLFADDAH